ncbi:MAG: DUF881 domain-containing protein [Actinomycetaceae bacterium]|nr:DUF881 domain-containing protein [Actinomycetaceae bacterium]
MSEQLPPPDPRERADEAPSSSIETTTPPAEEQRTASRSPWKMMGAALVSTPRMMHLLLLVICFSLGFAVVTQVRAQREDPLESLNEEDLVVLLDELSARETTLRDERSNLQTQLRDLQDAASQQEAAEEAARSAEEVSKINAGLLPVKGQGVTMRVDDARGSLNATSFVTVLGELRNAGAEAIELNGHRLTPRSSFTAEGQKISVDGQVISSPYEWKIIGHSQTIATALEIQAGSASQMRAKGANVTIEQVEEITIESVAPAPQLRWAKVK